MGSQLLQIGPRRCLSRVRPVCKESEQVVVSTMHIRERESERARERAREHLCVRSSTVMTGCTRACSLCMRFSVRTVRVSHTKKFYRLRHPGLWFSVFQEFCNASAQNTRGTRGTGRSVCSFCLRYVVQDTNCAQALFACGCMRMRERGGSDRVHQSSDQSLRPRPQTLNTQH